MNNRQLLKWSVIIIISVVMILFFGYRYKKTQKKELYRTAKFQRRDITHIVNATGSIEAKDTVKVGSVINGVVKELYVEENDKVKKDQVIALLDNGKGDTDVKSTLGALNRAKARLKYQEAFFKRQQRMYEKKHISLNELQQSESTYEEAKFSVDEAQAFYEKAFIDYENIKIVSPINGVIIKKNVSLGQGVSSFLDPTVLYTIAKDLTKMKVELEIDETTVGDIESNGKEAHLRFDTYPNKVFKGNIHDVSNGPTISKGTVSYKAYIYLDNDQLLLRPGMTVHADILVAHKENVLAVPGYIFAINPKLIEYIAKNKKFDFKPLKPEQLEEFKKTITNKDNPVKTIWIVENKSFEEKAVEVGITDKIFFEIVSGLQGDENILVDVEETDVMKQMFKRLFGGGMSK